MGHSLAFELTRVCHGGCDHSVTLGVVRQGMGAVLNRVRAVPGRWVELEAPHARTEGRLERRHNSLPVREWGISLAFKLTRVCHIGCDHSVAFGVVGRMETVLNRVGSVPWRWLEAVGLKSS